MSFYVCIEPETEVRFGPPHWNLGAAMQYASHFEFNNLNVMTADTEKLQAVFIDGILTEGTDRAWIEAAMRGIPREHGKEGRTL